MGILQQGRDNVQAAYNKTQNLEDRYLQQRQPAPQPAPQIQPQPRALGVDPMANINAQRQQLPAQGYQAPSRTDMDGYVGFLKQADIAKDYMSANQAVPGSINRSINRTQDSFKSKYPSFQDQDLQNRAADYLSSFGYQR